jgi:hypothetical protein
MEKTAATPFESVSLISARSKELQVRWQQEREEQAAERRAGRLVGKLSHGLREKLRSCNPGQLKRVKKLCDRFIEDHRKPPPQNLCGKAYTVRVLESVTVGNRRFQLEFRRTTRRAKRVYVNGPYIVEYLRDGSFIKWRYIKKDRDLRVNLPKKVWLAFRGHLDNPETEALRQKLIVQEQALENV